jgi:hypothetical protein
MAPPEFDYDKIQDAVTKGVRAGGGFANTADFRSTFGALPGVSKNLENSFNPLSKAFEAGSKVAGMVASEFASVQKAIAGGIGTWQELGAVGANFNNDIVKMSVSAASARLNLDQFSSLLKTYSAGISFLGGNVADGANQFSQLSNKMFESGMKMDGQSLSIAETSDKLRLMGYTSEDLNRILALTVSSQRFMDRTKKDSDERAISSAQDLAIEMDKNVKLLGISRKDQEKILEQAQLDQQIEARMRLIGLEKGDTAEANARKADHIARITATQTGTLEAYKDMVANDGNVTTKRGALQLTLLNEQGQGARDLARATLQGNLEATKEAQHRIYLGAEKNDKDISLNQMRTYGDNAKQINDILGPAAIGTKTVVDNLRAIRSEEKFKGATDQQIIQEALERVAKSQKSEPEAGLTRGAVLIDARLKDINAALMKGVAGPLNEKLGPDVARIANKYLGVVTPGGNIYGAAMTQLASMEQSRAANPTNTGSGSTGSNNTPATEDAEIRENIRRRRREGTNDLTGGNLVGSIANITGKIGAMTATGIEHFAIDGIQRYANEGTVTKPTLALVGDNPGGIEHIMRDSTVKSLLSSFRIGGIEEGLSKATGMMNTLPTQVGDMLPKAQNLSADFGQGAGQDDVVKAIEQLNKNLVSHFSELTNTFEKQVRATKQLNPNVSLR